ncbi:adenylyl-sulfate kinase [Patulibacter brassicae]|uniref:Adenylyl-sulfate kinase n=1 Tax=Patulibacter brassicae TaxID=1705717 RepID=A0ABU4VL45_9ACTN|nr:adenylyl-sulfate kinase [Patulibacter brassicae]MDX8152513.1 adenylyl-sulfate kinase [Patulibacter brassicae]
MSDPLRDAEAHSAERRSPHVKWHEGHLAREDRWRALDQQGATVWLTGLPASGKSTIAVELERELVAAGRFAYLLDGDNVRHGLSGDLGFDRAGRSENVRRVGHVARFFADAGGVAVASLVSPFREDRWWVRALHAAAALPFVEVFVDTPLEECRRRDPKGLYARSTNGGLPDMTGDGSPYEPPLQPEVRVRTAHEDVDAAVARIVAALADTGPAVATVDPPR